MQHKTFIKRHLIKLPRPTPEVFKDPGVTAPLDTCSVPQPPKHCLPGKWTEDRVWQCQPCPTRLVHITGLLQLARARRTRTSFPIARMQVGVCSARVQAGLRLRSGHCQRGAPPPAPGYEPGLGSTTARPTRAPRSPGQGLGDASSSTVSRDWKLRPPRETQPGQEQSRLGSTGHLGHTGACRDWLPRPGRAAHRGKRRGRCGLAPNLWGASLGVAAPSHPLRERPHQ